MKLTLIENTPKVRKGTDLCAIKINKYGQVVLTEKAVKHMGLELGDAIAILQDSDSPDDFYLLPGCKKTGLPVLRKLKPSSRGHLCTNYQSAVRQIQTQFGLEAKTHTILVGGAVKSDEGRVFALITKALKKEVSNG